MTYDTAIKRWAAVGPYYAMFPLEFAFSVVRRYSRTGDGVLDPFVGRGSSIYAAACLNRRGYGVEINPVGWVYGKVKLNPAMKRNVSRRLVQIGTIANSLDERWAKLPPFFTHCYCPETLRLLIAGRKVLNWKTSTVDRTLMAFLLIYLHGRRGSSLSNQMRDGKSMSPQYSIAWWKRHRLPPPTIDPVSFLQSRIEWRYRKGSPAFDNATIHLGDSVEVLSRMAGSKEGENHRGFKLLFTSPPYCGVTNYHYDQWLRLWLLGGASIPTAQPGYSRGKFESEGGYRNLLENVFDRSRDLLARDAIVYVRTDAREFTLDTTAEALQRAFPRKRLRRYARPLDGFTQTALFGDQTKKPGDVDIVLR